jgi:hypothetical protein
MEKGKVLILDEKIAHFKKLKKERENFAEISQQKQKEIEAVINQSVILRSPYFNHVSNKGRN